MLSVNSSLEAYFPYLAEQAALAGAPGAPGAPAKTPRRPHLSPSESIRYGQALKKLQRGLTGERILAGAGYFSEPSALGAYLIYYWPVSYAQTRMALAELEARGALPSVVQVLDIGSGPGPGAFAALDFGATRVDLLDAEADALKSAGALKAGHENRDAILTCTQVNLERSALPPGGPYDLIIAGHSMNELWKDRSDAVRRRADLLEQATSLLSDRGVLLVIEPSALVTSLPTLELRDILLSNRKIAGGPNCVAPCPGSMPCPIKAAGGNRTCHSTWAWNPPHFITALAGEAGLDRDSVKATWFAISKKEPDYDNAVAKNKLSKDAEEIPNTIIGRVVSEGMRNKAGRIRYILCTKTGLATLSARADDPAAKAAGFFTLDRGDLISAANVSPREGESSFGFSQSATLDIRFRALRV